MFDLTLEVSPPKTAKKFYVPEPDGKSVESIAPLEHATSTPPIRPRHSVTFAPIIVTRPPSPHAYNRGHLTLGSPAAASEIHCASQFSFLSISLTQYLQHQQRGLLDPTLVAKEVATRIIISFLTRITKGNDTLKDNSKT